MSFQLAQVCLNYLKFKVELCQRGDFLLGSGMEKWLSGRKRFFAKEVNLKRVPRVRIPPSPPFQLLENFLAVLHK